MTKHSLVQSRRSGRVLTLTLNNPPMNFLTSPMMEELNDTLKALEQDREIGAVILTSGVEGIFLTHFDVDEIEQAAEAVPFAVSTDQASLLTRTAKAISAMPNGRRLIRSTPMAGVADMNLYHEVTARMRRLDKVLIAAINGRAMGGGCELALACDLRIMVAGSEQDGVMIGQPEILLGLIPGGGGTQFLTRSLGVAKALEHCLEGRPLSPQQALELGMVNQVVQADQLMDAANSLAERMARRSPQAVAAIKHAVYQSASHRFDQGMQEEKSAFLSMATQANTRHASTQYITRVRDMIQKGQQPTIEDFQDMIEGTAFDMTSR
ncbi:enoyl-CoA hydratase/isomerase family protein [Alcanivorax sp. IL3]|uniref:enoyl-CoA hydratase/isomerase family protein n=1 Tax=unclassified Alcanivorax TaxID=2638842 RepID=UPI0039C254AB